MKPSKFKEEHIMAILKEQEAAKLQGCASAGNEWTLT